jgi:hypothetical protein
MDLAGEIKNIAVSCSAETIEKGGALLVSKTVAERKAFLSKRKLVYSARISIDDGKKEITFSEALKETGFGLSAGDDTPGFGFKSESYKTGLGPRQGHIEEQSNLFGKKYQYTFDFSKFRGMIEEKAVQAGYLFQYKVF